MNTLIEDFYQKASQVVINVTGVEHIFQSNQEEAVDARSILIYILSEKGITDTQIASLTHLTRQGVNKLKNSARYRKQKFSFASNLQQIRNELL